MRLLLQGLLSLSLEENRLSGSLPRSWGSLSELVFLDLASNAFTGSVPATWSNWSQVGKKLFCLTASCQACNSHHMLYLIADFSPLAGTQSPCWDGSVHAGSGSPQHVVKSADGPKV